MKPTESSIDNRRRWLRASAARVMCPPCKGTKRPERMADHIKSHCCICPRCEKTWQYDVDISKKPENRVTTWRYHKVQVKGILSNG